MLHWSMNNKTKVVYGQSVEDLNGELFIVIQWQSYGCLKRMNTIPSHYYLERYFVTDCTMFLYVLYRQADITRV